ncbi:putative cytochrome c oxidase subunit 5b-like [Solanum pennellii]|uniref:Cytochrome c oxidase subunit 5b-like n=1 Tax=Solanum pennellii TaxID=28526 RepID=A0ABM1FU84_SOLPN|nr:putative cytochrome c oxidase subunit 5b-like [Solanum pennellii]
MSRKLSSHLRTLHLLRSTPKTNSFAAATTTTTSVSSSPSPAAFRSSVTFFPRHFSTVSENVVKKVEDVMPIATGHEREELEAELQGRDILDINFPEGPFGTKEAPAVVKSYYDRRIVGCPGDEGEDEHDVVWFWLEKGKPHECPVCSQYFVLEVVGPGGPPDGHGSDDEGHH